MDVMNVRWTLKQHFVPAGIVLNLRAKLKFTPDSKSLMHENCYDKYVIKLSNLCPGFGIFRAVPSITRTMTGATNLCSKYDEYD